MKMAVTENGHFSQKRKVPDGYELVPPDGNYAWVIAFACFMGGLMTSAQFPQFSVLLDDLILLYDTDTATISWIPSLYIAIGQFLGPVNTVIINTFGVRKSAIISSLTISFGTIASYFVHRIELLTVTYGVIIGFGTGLNHVCYPIILSQYFRKYYGVAIGFLAASFPMARLVYTPLTQYLREAYGTREVFLILGANTLNGCVLAALFQPIGSHLKLVPINGERKHLLPIKTVEDDESLTRHLVKHEDKEKFDSAVNSASVSQLITIKDINHKDNGCCLPWCYREICGKIDFTLFSEPCFYLIAANSFLLLCITAYGNLFLFSLGVEKGNSPLALTSIISAKAITDIAARIGGPMLITYFNLSTRKSYIYVGFINGLVFAAIMYIDSYQEIMVWSMASGIALGIISSLSRVLIVETMGTQQLSSVLGLSSFITGCFMLPVAPALGWIRDITGSFVNIYLVFSILQFVMVLLWIIKPYLPQKPPRFSF